MIERKLESVILREMGIQKKLGELNAETRRSLQQFCMKWADIFDGEEGVNTK